MPRKPLASRRVIDHASSISPLLGFPPCWPRRCRSPGARSIRRRRAAAVHSTALVGWDAAAFSDQAYDPRWWRQLDDPVLAQLEDAALAANHDVRSAIARLDAARAVFDEDRRNRYPKVTAGASADLRDQAMPGSSTQPLRINTYRAGFDASWELDLFGRVRAAIAAASANAESFEAALAAVRVSVAADVARDYFELRGLQQRHGGARPQPGQSARDAAADDGAARRGDRRGAGRGQRRRPASRRSRRSSPRCAPRSRPASTGSRC